MDILIGASLLIIVLVVILSPVIFNAYYLSLYFNQYKNNGEIKNFKAYNLLQLVISVISIIGIITLIFIQTHTNIFITESNGNPNQFIIEELWSLQIRAVLIVNIIEAIFSLVFIIFSSRNQPYLFKSIKKFKPVFFLRLLISLVPILLFIIFKFI